MGIRVFVKPMVVFAWMSVEHIYKPKTLELESYFEKILSFLVHSLDL